MTPNYPRRTMSKRTILVADLVPSKGARHPRLKLNQMFETYPILTYKPLNQSRKWGRRRHRLEGPWRWLRYGQWYTLRRLRQFVGRQQVALHRQCWRTPMYISAASSAAPLMTSNEQSHQHQRNPAHSIRCQPPSWKSSCLNSVSYTHLTLPTNREV